MTATATAPSLRLSSVTNACPRKAVYEATDAPARERTDREERLLFRGKRLGRDYADMLAHKYGEKNIERERKIQWPLGVGHADIYLPETRTIIEVLSSAHAGEQMLHGKLLQLVAYIEHDPDATSGALVVLNPADYTEDRTILHPDSPQYKALVAEMRVRVEQVIRWRDTGTLPMRVCQKPSDAIGRFCLHAAHCFEGWEPPPLEQIAADETLVAAVETFAAEKAEQAALERSARAHEERKKEAQVIIEAAELPAGTDVQIGAYRVRRTHVNRKPTFEWEKAEMAGLFEPGLYGDYFKPGSSYSTFKAERVDLVDADMDYGEVPF